MHFHATIKALYHKAVTAVQNARLLFINPYAYNPAQSTVGDSPSGTPGKVEHAKRTTGAEKTSRPDRNVGHGRQNRHWRNPGQHEIGQSPFGQGRCESAQGRPDARTALGDRPQSGKREVGVMADFDLAKKKAAELLSEFRITEPPVDPERIAEGLGVDVVYADFKPEYTSIISGFLELSKDKSARIVVNRAISPKRKTFTIAHELAHYILHKEYASGNKYQVMMRSNNHDAGKPDEEKEADAFAAALLAPKEFILKYKDIASLPEMSKIFVASEDMLKWRLHNIERFGN